MEGAALIKEIQKRCRIQPGMLVTANVGNDERQPSVTALVVGLSPSCRFEQDYPDADEHLFYICRPIGNAPEFVDYVMNMEEVK